MRDLGSGDDAARNFSLLILVNNIGPIVAPVVGGQLLHVTDWRGIFVVLAAPRPSCSRSPSAPCPRR